MAGRELRALVTRPRDEAETLAASLATRGIEAIIEPLMQVRYLASPVLDFKRVQAILCTSANGVRALALATAERGLPVLAVGDATAARARSEGFRAVESAGGDITALVRLASSRLRPEDGPLLHVSGSVVAGDLVGALRQRGFDVGRRVLYETEPATVLSPTAVEALRAGAADFALFFSPRTAAIFSELAAAAEVTAHCARMTALSLSRAADDAIGHLGWIDRRVAERPNQSALLAALDRVLSEWSNR